MKKQNPDNTPEEQAPAQNAASGKWAQRKAQRKEKKAHYKQLRKDLRKQKREAFKAKTFLGKTAWVLGRALVVLFVAMTLFTVARVNFTDTATALLTMFAQYKAAAGSTMEISQEQLLEVAPMDEARGARIDASAPLEEGETWAIYMYMVGSDLESPNEDQLSDVAKYLVEREAVPLQQEREETLNAQLNSMVDTILDNGMDLPNAMYAKNLGQAQMGFIASSVIDIVNKGREGYFGAATSVIDEIMAATLPENVKLVLQPGGSKSWGNNMINPNRTQRFLYDSQGMHKVYEGHLSNMANPQTLVDFLTFCEEEYPADHTMIIFWNHGNAAFGYGRDGIYLEDNLTLKELRWAFQQVYTLDEENPPIDVIGFDACLMASMEAANTLNGVARYMVGNEEVGNTDCWDYTDLLNRLGENPRMNPLQLSRAVVDSYMDYYGKKSIRMHEGALTVLYSALDLRYADDLYRAYSDFAYAALEQSSHYAGTAAYLGKAANTSIKFASVYQDEYNTVDLGLFMQGMEDMLQEEARAVLKVLEDVVVYHRKGNGIQEATGITVHYPATVNTMAGLKKAVQYIEQICDDPAIRALYYYKVAGCLPEELQAYVAEQGYEILPMNPQPLKAMQKTNVTVLEDGNMTLPLTDDAATITQEYRYHLLQVEEDGTARRLGDSSYLLINETGGLQSAFDGRWIQIDGTWLMVKVVSGTPTSVRFLSPVKHNGTTSNLLLSVDLQTQEWSVLGIQTVTPGITSRAMADRTNSLLKPGDTLIPVYEQYDIHTGVGTEVTGQSITWKEDSKVTEAPLPDGTYMSYISLVDARGDVYDMQVTTFDIKNGTMGNGEIVKMP